MNLFEVWGGTGTRHCVILEDRRGTLQTQRQGKKGYAFNYLKKGHVLYSPLRHQLKHCQKKGTEEEMGTSKNKQFIHPIIWLDLTVRWPSALFIYKRGELTKCATKGSESLTFHSNDCDQAQSCRMCEPHGGVEGSMRPPELWIRRAPNARGWEGERGRGEIFERKHVLHTHVKVVLRWIVQHL